MNIEDILVCVTNHNSNNNQLSKNDYLYVVSDGNKYHKKVKTIIDEFKDYSFNLEVIYEVDNKGYWGHGIRNKYQKLLKGDYILHADDDDIYINGSINAIKKAINKYPGKMLLFKFYQNYSKKIYFWKEPVLMLNNIGTPCGVIPNIPDNMGEWGYRYGGDFDFYKSCKFDKKFIDEYIYVVKPKINGYEY